MDREGGEVKLIFEKEKKELYNLLFAYHASNKMSFNYVELDELMESIIVIFKEEK